MSASTSAADRRTETRRVVGLLDKSIAGPVASLWASSLHRTPSFGRLSDSGSNPGQRTRFCTTKTEDAVDGGCIIPCALEEWFRPVLENNNKFGNPAKLKFRYSAH